VSVTKKKYVSVFSQYQTCSSSFSRFDAGKTGRRAGETLAGDLGTLPDAEALAV